ncbi:MAG TPA: LamG domain-containing protein [Thermoguttaceae bacterium]|nr:LamG domain-containing protein [Thermoguttaceae bacterium]HPP52841.1 LamG domain-containing protein [Thermoguttaceae bacterium]
MKFTYSRPAGIFTMCLGVAFGLVGGIFSSAPAAAAVLNPYQEAVLASSPWVYYTFEDPSTAQGSTAGDASGNGYTGVYGTNVVTVQGPHGIGAGGLPNATAVKLGTGTLDSTSFIKGSTLGNFGSQMTGPFSIEFWVNTTDTSSIQQPIARLEGADNTALVIDFNRWAGGGDPLAGRTSFYLRAKSGNLFSQAIDTNIYDGKWHHVVFAVDNPLAGTMRIYVDGQLQSPVQNIFNLSSGDTFANFADGLGLLAVNNRASGADKHFKGALDEVAIYTHALSAAEIQAHLAALPQYRYSYDGTYQPNDAAPPLGQTTWSLFNNINADRITPNVGGNIGYARFNDDSTGGRLSFYHTIGEDLSDDGWFYEARLKIDSLTSYPVFVGVRDEGGSGKTIMLGWSATGALGFYDNSSQLVQLIDGANFIDGQYHLYRVEKRMIGPTPEIQIWVDGVRKFAASLPYSLFPDDPGNTQGFGFFSSTAGTSNFTFDYLVMGPLVPEPASVVLLGLGGLLGLVVYRRKLLG